MEKKKSVQANLEKFKSSFIMIGLILAVSTIIYAFSWKSVEENRTPFGVSIIVEEDYSKITRNDLKKEEIKPEKPIPKKIFAEIINLVHDSTKVKDVTLASFNETLTIDELPIEEPAGILFHSEISPKFPGGIEALQLYIAKHVVYPAVARENGIQGTVSLRFEVTKTGHIGKIEVYNKNQDALLKDAAIDVIKNLPKFKPGMQNDQKVNVWFSIPISFKLN